MAAAALRRSSLHGRLGEGEGEGEELLLLLPLGEGLPLLPFGDGEELPLLLLLP